jgi:putative ABC transport system substrate-binding protein
MARSKIIAFMFLVAALVSLSAVPKAEAGKKVGVILWSEERRYSESKDGVIEQLQKEGFGAPSVSYTIENAGGSKAKVARMTRLFAGARMDMIIAIGTSAAVTVAEKVKDIPVVFSMVYDPVESKIANDWKSSGNNTTGASPRVPMYVLVERLMELAPVRRLAVLYTPGEKNSEVQLLELRELQTKYNITIIPVIALKDEEISRYLPEVLRTADAVYLSGSSAIGNSIGTIVEMATKAGVITVTHLSDLVDQGVLLGVCADPYQVGRLAGRKAAKILKGAKPSSIPIETLNKLELFLNMKTARAGKFKITPAFMKKVTKTTE